LVPEAALEALASEKIPFTILTNPHSDVEPDR
jgi:hypothetical protein